MHQRCMEFKDRGPVVVTKGVKTPNHARTPRTYTVITKKRSGGRNKKAVAARCNETRQQVFGSDDSDMTDWGEE